MWIDKLAIYKYDREYSEPNKKQKPLQMQIHLIKLWYNLINVILEIEKIGKYF